MKKCLMFLSLLFSFLFIGNVSAYTQNGVDLTDTFFSNGWTVIENNLNYDRMDYPYVFCYSDNSNVLKCVFFKNSSTNYRSYQDYIGYGYRVDNTITDESTLPAFTYNKSNNTYSSWNWTKSNSYFYPGYPMNTNVDYYYNGSKVKSKSFDYTPTSSKKNINFHLNGGIATDFLNENVITHEENYQINADSEELAQYIVNLSMFKENSVFLGWYYDSNFTQAYDGNDNISSDIDLYAKWAYNPNITFHLNGGVIRIYDSESGNSSGSSGGGSSSGGGRHEDQFISEDFTERINYDEISNYIVNTIPTKATMIFEGWYYDENFKTPFNINDTIDEDKNLYAKWRYEHVDDFLEHTNFNNYTFDTNYGYAIITKGDNSGDIYLGLNVNNPNITVYQYDENINDYKNEQARCLVPVYSKDNIYYYLLNTNEVNGLEVLVLPKTVFENGNYNFLLTDNAYITYTNNLEQSIIYNENGEQISTNLDNIYSTYQNSLIEDEKDLLVIFKRLLNFKDNKIFENVETIWNKLKATDLYIYLMILVVGSLIITIIKGARRN